MTQCTAKSKRSGERCKRAAAPGRKVCYVHGGKTPRGPALPQFKTGRYSKYLPTGVLDSYHAALADEDLLATRDSIALAESRIVDLLKTLDVGAGKALWEQARTSLAALQQAIRDSDGEKIIESLRQLDKIIGGGVTQAQAWNEIGDWMERARRLRETEQRRLVAMQQMITSEQAMVLVAALTMAVKNNVSDPVALRAITDEFARTIGAPGANKPAG